MTIEFWNDSKRIAIWHESKHIPDAGDKVYYREEGSPKFGIVTQRDWYNESLVRVKLS